MVIPGDEISTPIARRGDITIWDRRDAYDARLSPESAYSPARCPAQVDRRTGRNVLEAIDVLLDRLVLVCDEEVDPGQILEQDLLDLLVISARFLIGLRDPWSISSSTSGVLVAREAAAIRTGSSRP